MVLESQGVHISHYGSVTLCYFLIAWITSLKSELHTGELILVHLNSDADKNFLPLSLSWGLQGCWCAAHLRPGASHAGVQSWVSRAGGVHGDPCSLFACQGEAPRGMASGTALLPVYFCHIPLVLALESHRMDPSHSISMFSASVLCPRRFLISGRISAFSWHF